MISMALTESLGAPCRARTRGVCSVAVALHSLSVEDRALAYGALADQEYGTTQIARALQSEGLAVSATGVARHRKGDCACRSGTA